MDLADLQKVAVPLASIIGGFVTLLGFFFYGHKRVIARLEAEKEKAFAEKLEAVQAKSAAETKADQARAARDAAVEEKDDILKKAKDLRGRYDTAVKQLADSKQQVDKLVADLASKSATHQQKMNDLQKAWERFASAKKAEIERLLGEKATVMLDKQQLEEKFQTEVQRLEAKAQTERQQLEEKLEEARAKLSGERKTIRETLKQQGKIWLAKVAKDAPAFRPLAERKTVIIAVLNLKGGVGKTTITANLAGLLGSQGKRVLMVDLDHQRSLSRMLLAGPELTSLVRHKKSIQAFLTADVKDGPQLLSNTVRVVGMENCELIVNHDPTGESDDESGLEELEMQLMMSWLLEREKTGDIRFHLRAGLHDDSVTNSYDYVFLDCPPRTSTACVNALAAADFVLVPVQGEAVAPRSVEHLIYRLRELRHDGPCASLRVLGVLGNLLHPMADMTTAPEVGRLRDVATQLSMQAKWPEPIRVFETVLPRMRQYLDASREIEDGNKLKLAATHYPAVRTQFEQLAKEIQERIDDHRNT